MEYQAPNARCACNSGRKFKKCCGITPGETAAEIRARDKARAEYFRNPPPLSEATVALLAIAGGMYAAAR